MNPRIVLDRKLQDAFREIITGKGTKRSRHQLTLDGVSVVGEFIEELERHGYKPSTVAKVSVQPGERVPAFYIEDTTAYFGWVFWEKFTPTKLRKLWGSVVKNEKGDWAIQIAPTKTTTVYANEKLKADMDLDHPTNV